MGSTELLTVLKTPWHDFNRLQQRGLSFILLGVVITAGILILNNYGPMAPNRRAGLLGGSEGFILVGVVVFLIGLNRRRKPDDSSHE